MRRLVQMLAGVALTAALVAAGTGTAQATTPAAATSESTTSPTLKLPGSQRVTGTATRPSRPKAIDPRCMVSGRALCIDKTKKKLHYMRAGKIVRTLDARFGCAGMRTREGRFSVLWKSRNHVSTIYHTRMPYAMFFSGGQAVHYSSDFAARGYAGCSHGCVNIRDKPGIRWVFDQMRVGERVVVYRS